jgi:hypothetical protein
MDTSNVFLLKLSIVDKLWIYVKRWSCLC